MPASHVMNEFEQEKKEREHQEDLQRLRGFRPMDDDFMRGMLKGNKDLAEFILRILMSKPSLILKSFDTQADMKRVTGARSVILDGYGTDDSGRKIDLEVQRADKGAGAKRARYNSSVMDIENLDAGQDFNDLPDTYTIFITERDFFDKGKAVYTIQRINTTIDAAFDDGTYILYVNGEYRGENDIGYLMHDFNCTDADDMHFPEMADRTRYLKENPKGVNEMCKSMEDMRDKARTEGKILGAIDMLKEVGIPENDIIVKVAHKYKVSEEYVRNLMHTAA